MKREVIFFYLKQIKYVFILLILVPLLLNNFLPNTFQSIFSQTNPVGNIEEYENTLFGET